MKIAVIGYSGAGKSTLAQQLAVRHACPLLHLDAVHFAAHWVERPDDEAVQDVLAVLDRPAWVIDGNYSALALERRMAEADEIVFLDFPRRICLFRCLKRYISNRGKTRHSMAEGCHEKFDREFFLWIMRDGRSPARRKGFERLAAQYPEKFHRLTTTGAVAKYLR